MGEGNTRDLSLEALSLRKKGGDLLINKLSEDVIL
jgi:hypothetical protein